MTYTFFFAENFVAFSDEKSHVSYLFNIWKLIYYYIMAGLNHLIHFHMLYSRAPLMPSDLPLHQSQVTTRLCRKAKMKLLNAK